jgi:hypothetical protein
LSASFRSESSSPGRAISYPWRAIFRGCIMQGRKTAKESKNRIENRSHHHRYCSRAIGERLLPRSSSLLLLSAPVVRERWHVPYSRARGDGNSVMWAALESPRPYRSFILTERERELLARATWCSEPPSPHVSPPPQTENQGNSRGSVLPRFVIYPLSTKAQKVLLVFTCCLCMYPHAPGTKGPVMYPLSIKA